jgi:hypothetical protein
MSYGEAEIKLALPSNSGAAVDGSLCVRDIGLMSA